MTADNTHATTRILGRVVHVYDSLRAQGQCERTAREAAATTLARAARIDYLVACELLADKLARRAEDKLKGE